MIDPDTVPTAWMDTNGVVDMTPDDYARMIPDAAVEAAALDLWDRLGTRSMEECRDIARAALAAGLAGWPNLKLDPWWDLRTHKRSVSLILPLPEVKP